MFFIQIIPSILSVCLAVLGHLKDDATTIKKTENVCLFPCIIFYQIYCVIFSYIQFTFPQHSECFLSNDTKNMHILASEPELQAVRLGYVFRRKLRRRGDTPKKLRARVDVTWEVRSEWILSAYYTGAQIGFRRTLLSTDTPLRLPYSFMQCPQVHLLKTMLYIMGKQSAWVTTALIF